MTEADIKDVQATLAPAVSAKQDEMPFAMVQGEPITEVPRDLYIPPQALEVFLEAFEGPLDLLLYLIKRQNLDVLDIPIADITQQYVQYIEMMQELQLELAGEYLLMAATLAEIKSRMLLPRADEEEDEDDPRAELVRRLQEYERYKKAALDLDEVPRLERDIYTTAAHVENRKNVEVLPDIQLKEVVLAFQDVLRRAEMFAHHHVQREVYSVRNRMRFILGRVQGDEFIELTHLFRPTEGRLGAIVTFLALLELLRGALIDVLQSEPYAPIYIKAAAAKGGDVERVLMKVDEYDTGGSEA